MHHAMGERAEARQCFAACRAKATDVFGLLELARALNELEEWEEAEGDLRRAIALNPQSAEAHNLLGTTLRLLRRFEEARAWYPKTPALNPEYCDAYLGLVSTRKFSDADRPLLEHMHALAA